MQRSDPKLNGSKMPETDEDDADQQTADEAVNTPPATANELEDETTRTAEEPMDAPITDVSSVGEMNPASPNAGDIMDPLTREIFKRELKQCDKEKKQASRSSPKTFEKGPPINPDTQEMFNQQFARFFATRDTDPRRVRPLIVVDAAKDVDDGDTENQESTSEPLLKVSGATTDDDEADLLSREILDREMKKLLATVDHTRDESQPPDDRSPTSTESPPTSSSVQRKQPRLPSLTSSQSSAALSYAPPINAGFPPRPRPCLCEFCPVHNPLRTDNDVRRSLEHGFAIILPPSAPSGPLMDAMRRGYSVILPGTNHAVENSPMFDRRRPYQSTVVNTGPRLTSPTSSSSEQQPTSYDSVHSQRVQEAIDREEAIRMETGRRPSRSTTYDPRPQRDQKKKGPDDEEEKKK